MIKLNKILEDIGTSFTTKRTGTDLDTGKISWDVEYFPDFSGILENMNTLISDLDRTIKKHSIKDLEALKILKTLRSTKNSLIKYLETQHPDYIKNYYGE